MSHRCTSTVVTVRISPHSVMPPYLPQEATCSATTAAAPAQTKVIVVPLHQVHPDRGHEAGSGTPPPPLVPFGQSSSCPEASSSGSHLTFPTLDDFIPPHLQKGPHHSQPPVASGAVPHLRPKLPSLSPPPSLVPPVTEGSSTVPDPESMGVTVRTVSLAARCCPDSFAKFMCPVGILNFEEEAACQQHDSWNLVYVLLYCMQCISRASSSVVYHVYSPFLFSVLFGDLLAVISCPS